LLKLFAQDFIPLDIVNRQSFRDFIKEISFFKLPSRTTNSRRLQDQYQRCRELAKKLVHEKGIGIALTTEEWTSIAGNNYIALLAHIRFEDGDANCICLDLLPTYSKVKAEDVHTHVITILKEYELQFDVCSYCFTFFLTFV